MQTIINEQHIQSNVYDIYYIHTFINAMGNYQTTETIQISLESILYLCDDSPVGGAISTDCRFNIFGMFCADRTVWL